MARGMTHFKACSWYTHSVPRRTQDRQLGSNQREPWIVVKHIRAEVPSASDRYRKKALEEGQRRNLVSDRDDTRYSPLLLKRPLTSIVQRGRRTVLQSSRAYFPSALAGESW